MKDTNVYSLNGRPTLILEAKEDGTAIVLTQQIEANVCSAIRSKVATSDLKPYACPHIEDTDPKRIYCKDGYCCRQLPDAGFVYLQFMCMQCLSDSMDAELEET